MAVFRFEFQALLNLRIQQEDSIKNELGLAMRDLELEKRKLFQLHSKEQSIIDLCKEQALKGVLIQQLRETYSYLDVVTQQIKIQLDVVSKAENRVNECRTRLIAAMQARKTLEKLREKQYNRFLEEEKRKEFKITDEIVCYRYVEKQADAV